ncbi:hypothetical protein SASPL_131806 [Salvia splendens]|uniref:Peroxidase n=1 Tax=Salvia splendens TaxID=180675 RepID=A0A8X8XAU5_SALSN|nr:peroxidase 9-like [Salvia splendens]KAG6408783.1 hypothetical protein SASPL_131806 [Salvia splendens]
MASFRLLLALMAVASLSCSHLEAFPASGHGGYVYTSLIPGFYDFSCPQANEIIMSVLGKAIAEDSRTAASLLRLHFHDCFVQGCDASVLLDGGASEKNARPNKNSLRGFQVIDEIKAELEQVCPHTVSCADILALAARDSVILSGGPHWEVALGRRDSTTMSLTKSNSDIPAPNSTIHTLLAKFKQQGLNEQDLVALSGGHTIGMARCTTFRQRLYSQPDVTLFNNGLRAVCPKVGGDDNLSPLDISSPRRFDNTYFNLLLEGRELLTSDQVLLSGNVRKTIDLVKKYAEDEALFFHHFAKSMVKMGSISPLLGVHGEIRKNCRRINSN